MPAHLTTKPQVNGYRFIIRRMEHALVRRDVRMLHEPMRSQARSLLVGAVLSALVMAGFGIAAWLSPAPDVSGAPVLLAEDSGALYVRVPTDGGDAAGGDAAGSDAAGGDAETLHPVLNLASARLVTGSAADPQRVPDDRLPEITRGAVVGIPGAPSLLPGRDDQVAGPWTVCDRLSRGAASRTTVLVGSQDSGPDSGARRLGSGDAVLVTEGGQDYLLYDGARLAVDPSDAAVSRALGLGGVVPARVSAALIRALPAGPELRAPAVDGSGTVPDYPVGAARVGDVVRVERGGGHDRFLVLRDGLQAVPDVVADLAAYGGGARPHAMSPREVSRAPTTRHPLDLRGYPDGAVRVRDGPGRVLCASWRAGTGGTSPAWRVLAGSALPTGRTPVDLVGADGAGPAADGFVLRPGAAAHVRGRRPGADAVEGGPRFLVDDTGTRFGIPDADTSGVLGLDRRSGAAPWAILRLLPAGPALTRADAMVEHEAIAPDPAPEALGGQ